MNTEPKAASSGGDMSTNDRAELALGRWSVQRYTAHGWAIGAYLVIPASGIYDRSLTVRIGRCSWSFQRERDGQPWPEVPECHRDYEPGHTCPQHDPTHEHTWAAGKSEHGPGIPVRCVVCGARKCDRKRCIRIRHHREDHSDWLGYNGTVGANGPSFKEGRYAAN